MDCNRMLEPEALTAEAVQELRHYFTGDNTIRPLPLECEIVVALCDFWLENAPERRTRGEPFNG